MTQSPSLGVAIVAFNSADVILGCLDSLFASRGATLRVVVTDNCSTDGTVSSIREWASRHAASDRAFTFAEMPVGAATVPEATLTLLHSPFNGGYAHGVNAGLALLMGDAALQLFWVLNPDCEVDADAAAGYLSHGADGNFSLMSGRTLYREPPGLIQTDGGQVNRWTGVCSSIHAGRSPDGTPMPSPRQADFLTGANLVASRRFVERAGLMEVDYFLYYEEVDWAWRRGDLPLRIVDDVIVYHHGGTAIGSGSTTRRATAFANYFNYRNRIRFLRRHRPIAVPFALVYGLAKAAQLTLTGGRCEAHGLLAGLLSLPPPAQVRDRVADGRARELAFGS